MVGARMKLRGANDAGRRLRRVIAIFFCLLALPLAYLFYWTWTKAENENFLTLRVESEAILSRIEERIVELVEPEEKRPFDEYSFFSVTQNAWMPQKGVRYSPLSDLPAKSAIPGLIGYYQINPDSSFQTPLLPEVLSENSASNVMQFAGISADERMQRKEIQLKLAQIVKSESAPPSKSAQSQQALATLNFDERYLNQNAAIQSESLMKSKVYSKKSEDYSKSRESRKEQLNFASQTNDVAAQARKIVTFEGEVDPIQLRVLENKKILFYRRVWRDKARYLQGFALEAPALFEEIFDLPFSQSPFSDRAILRVSYADSVIHQVGNAPATSEAEKVIFKGTLAAPFQDFQVIISAPRLQLGAGVMLMYALSGCIVVVLIVGLLLIYRLALTQIELSEQKSDFVSAVSHELKTPLTSIRMYAEMLRAGWVKDKEKERSYYDFIFFESERLSRLIANVLQLSGLARDDSPLTLKKVEIRSVLALIQEKVQAQVQQAGFTLRVQPHGLSREVYIDVDEDALCRVFINLIDNSLKFSKDATKKEIEFGYRIDETRAPTLVQIYVRDFGPGVAPNEQGKIFELFYRSESELTRSTPGTGIGLALVKELCRKMQADVEVCNRETGAEFSVLFTA